MSTIYTQAYLDALDESIAQGAVSVKYGDKEVNYGSLANMIKTRRFIAGKLGLLKPQHATAEFHKGVGHNGQRQDPYFFY